MRASDSAIETQASVASRRVRTIGAAKGGLVHAMVVVACLALGACATKPLMPYSADTPPLVLAPAFQAGVQDKRARFRETYCAVLEAHGRGQTAAKPRTERNEEAPHLHRCRSGAVPPLLPRFGLEPTTLRWKQRLSTACTSCQKAGLTCENLFHGLARRSTRLQSKCGQSVAKPACLFAGCAPRPHHGYRHLSSTSSRGVSSVSPALTLSALVTAHSACRGRTPMRR